MGVRQFAHTGQPAGKGVELLELLRGHRLEGFERSFKMSGKSLLADRFLAGIHKADLPPAELFSLCARMGMPRHFADSMRANAEAANAFHFGFEGSGEGGLYKVYLEFAAQLKPAAGDSTAPQRIVLLYLAYKWEVADPAACTVARYECFPGLTTKSILRRIAALCGGSDEGDAVTSMQEILGLAAGRTAKPPMYLEVSEENNPRASFDVNLHEAGLNLAAIEPWLERQRDRFGIPAAELEPVYAPARQQPLGHLSGGINREGRDFLTVYYAAEAS